jgi:hypothetical protein
MQRATQVLNQVSGLLLAMTVLYLAVAFRDVLPNTIVVPLTAVAITSVWLSGKRHSSAKTQSHATDQTPQ